MAAEPIHAIAVAIARTRNRRLLAAMLLLPFSGFLIAVPILSPHDEGALGTTIAVMVLAGVLLLFALFFASIAYRLRNPRKSPIMELLTGHPENVAWVYTTSHTRNGFEVARTVVIYAADGSHQTVVVTKKDESSVFADLAKAAPHAAVGYSKEIAAQYREKSAALDAERVSVKAPTDYRTARVPPVLERWSEPTRRVLVDEQSVLVDEQSVLVDEQSVLVDEQSVLVARAVGAGGTSSRCWWHEQSVLVVLSIPDCRGW